MNPTAGQGVGGFLERTCLALIRPFGRLDREQFHWPHSPLRRSITLAAHRHPHRYLGHRSCLPAPVYVASRRHRWLHLRIPKPPKSWPQGSSGDRTHRFSHHLRRGRLVRSRDLMRPSPDSWGLRKVRGPDGAVPSRGPDSCFSRRAVYRFSDVGADSRRSHERTAGRPQAPQAVGSGPRQVAHAERLLGQMRGRDWLMASLMYGTGLRLMECVQLRIQDVDFGYRQITAHQGKGATPHTLRNDSITSETGKRSGG